MWWQDGFLVGNVGVFRGNDAYLEVQGGFLGGNAGFNGLLFLQANGSFPAFFDQGLICFWIVFENIP